MILVMIVIKVNNETAMLSREIQRNAREIHIILNVVCTFPTGLIQVGAWRDSSNLCRYPRIETIYHHPKTRVTLNQL